ncbi:kelch-like protein 38 [Ruditapes philippinarum]|uniref:kelch-like protein 38 n=1 Tax=Ruditapes philippinarum TaxID=129788 RepID=UPI00295C2D1E|nr:kelch-like protein 38 [Ruditapes philippinarum]
MTSPLSPGIVPENVDTETISKPFTESGKCKDEVTLTFDDGQILFVSQNFLILASPVFEAMLCGDFKETQTRNVDLKEKKYDSFLEFLMCIHPGTTTTVNRDNVLDMIHIAEEYQVTRIVYQCKLCLKQWLNDEFETARKRKYIEDYVKPARNCLYILKTAVVVNNSELITLGVEIVSQFGHEIYLGLHKTDFIPDKKMFSECTEVFKSLPADVKYDVLARRLALYPDNNFKVVESVKLGKQVSQSGN